MKLTSDKIQYIVVHCADTTADMDIGAKEIDRWHRERTFIKIGYHFVIRRDGSVEKGRALDEVGAHVQGYNEKSLGICMVGGAKKGEAGKLLPDNNFTQAQWTSLIALLLWLKVQYPKAEIVGHNDLTTKKYCPSFVVGAWLQTLYTRLFTTKSK